ncbi:hypothetical protein EV175_006916, partial [Coemansia sp. RSA 1933]
MLCRRCGKPGHKAVNCPESSNRCYNCNGTDHLAKDCPHEQGSELRECFECHETGHFAKDCPTRKVASSDDSPRVEPRSKPRSGSGRRGVSRREPENTVDQNEDIVDQNEDAADQGQGSRGRRGAFRGARGAFRSGGLGDRDTVICHNCGLPNHMAKGCTKPMAKCYVCSRSGHIARFCFRRGEDNGSSARRGAR